MQSIMNHLLFSLHTYSLERLFGSFFLLDVSVNVPLLSIFVSTWLVDLCEGKGIQ